MNEPLVSLIIPCFNREKYLPATLDGCLQQTYQNLEIIIVDDGSTDNSWHIINNYSKINPHIKAVHTVNQGQCAARNHGLKLAEGQYIKFLDSDDILLPKAIECQVQALTHCQADVSACGKKLFWDEELTLIKEKLISNFLFSPDNGELYKSFLDLIFDEDKKLTFNEVLIAKYLLDDVCGFDSSLRGAEELNLFLRLAIKNPKVNIVFHAEVLLLKRIGYYSLAYQLRTQPRNPWLLLSLMKAGKYYLNNHKLQNNKLKRYIFYRLYISMTYAYRDGLIEEALSAYYIWKSSKLRPPILNPWYHHLFHKILGFIWAEKILSIVRKLKYLR
ncbi:glycosyltransferase family 2 protein [Coleofasciculus chthonoplastes]|uniref:glycosyltransferase family 2 protein n=1 Tax=Coleofasciculus chthonoplastes TaxID=64178 RepID=UPI0032F92EB1